MATYLYRCPDGHETEVQMAMAGDKPESFVCAGEGDVDVGASRAICGKRAPRVFLPPAAVHYKGAGTYTTDYKLKFDRKRRKNPGDGLPLPPEAAITRAEGAEY